MAKTVSGKQTIKILTRHFHFAVVHQKGSHVKLARKISKETITTVVPNHKELARGTIKGILKLAKVSEKDFWELL